MKIRVLLVDDEKEFVETLAERLRSRGFEVSNVLSGNDALTAIRSGSFDVVVLDVLMPEMDGIKVFSEIKKMDPLLPVIVLTGHAKIETAIGGMKAGVYDYLIKPAKIEELAGKIIMAHKHKAVNKGRLGNKTV
jgi:DNA-binding NtrC family response regulator